MRIWRAFFMVTTAVAAGTGAMGEGTLPPAGPVNVLVLRTENGVDERVIAECKARNIHLVQRKAVEPLSMEMLRQFHVVVVTESRVSHYILPDQVSNELTMANSLRLIEQYVKEGGSLFFGPTASGSPGGQRDTELLKPYGARVLSLQVRDDAHSYVPEPPPRTNAGYSWTTKITAHPATAGVRCIFYPTPQHRWDDHYSTTVFRLDDPAWEVLVRGMDTSTASRAVSYTDWSVVEATPPPIAAVRGYGRGRVGILAVMPYYTFWYPYWRPEDHPHEWGRGQIGERTTGDIDGIFMQKGGGGRTSQGLELLVGMFRWLAGNAREAGMGNYTEDGFAGLAVPEKVPAPEWLFKWTRELNLTNFKILIGARSKFSDGKGTPADYARAARAAGISVLCMTETFESFDPATWDEYRRACRDASDDRLTVMAGLDIADRYGMRYLLLNSPVFPQPFMLSKDGKILEKVAYLCLCFPGAISVAHRVTTSPIPHHLIKHFQAISIHTYDEDGQLLDNSFPAYEWEMFRFSNPMPFAVHEIYSPDKVTKASSTGLQVYAAAPSQKDLLWSLGKHGTAHFWESPVHLQVSSGPLLTAFGGWKPFFSLESGKRIKDVRLFRNYGLYRRWTPDSAAFSVDTVVLPEPEFNFAFLVATDADGGQLISSGLKSGRDAIHSWRCADRQNWWGFPNIYTGTTITGFDIRVPVFGTAEGSGGYRGFVQVTGPQRGDNPVALLDFPIVDPAVYVQDVFLDQRYYRAIEREVCYDYQPANATARSRVYEGRVRYHKFYSNDARGTQDSLPELKSITLRLRRPVVPEEGDIFPIVSSLDMQNYRLRGDMTYAYSDPKTGKKITGKLTSGYVDIPPSGRVGGLIVVSGSLRVAADSRVGFAPLGAPHELLPTGTTWQAEFVSVPPEHADRWRKLIGVAGETPYALAVSRGKLGRLALIAECRAEDGGICGTVSKPLAAAWLENITASTSTERLHPTFPLREYRLPLKIAGVNRNWPTALWRPGGRYEPITVFEDHAWARLDVTRAGTFYAGNTLMSDVPHLRLAIVGWTGDGLEFEVNNTTDKAVKAHVWTESAIEDRFQAKRLITVGAGTSQVVKWARE